MKTKLFVAALLVFAAGLVAVLAGLLLWQGPAFAEAAGTLGTAAPEAQKWGFIAAAAATAIGAVGAGYAVATVGAAGVGALTEKPELFGRVLIMVGLAEGIAIYGLIVSVLILNRL